jgi:hypothetical protein
VLVRVRGVVLSRRSRNVVDKVRDVCVRVMSSGESRFGFCLNQVFIERSAVRSEARILYAVSVAYLWGKQLGLSCLLTSADIFGPGLGFGGWGLGSRV